MSVLTKSSPISNVSPIDVLQERVKTSTIKEHTYFIKLIFNKPKNQSLNNKKDYTKLLF